VGFFPVQAKVTKGGQEVKGKGGDFNTSIFLLVVSLVVLVLSIVWLARRKEGRGLAIAVLVVGAIAALCAVLTIALSTSVDSFVQNINLTRVRRDVPGLRGQSDDAIRNLFKGIFAGGKTSIGPGAIISAIGALAQVVGGVVGETRKPAAAPVYAPPPYPQQYGAPPPPQAYPPPPPPPVPPQAYPPPPPPQGYPPPPPPPH